MTQDYFRCLGLVALLLLGSSVAYSQQKQVHVGDDGIIIPAEQSVHAKAGQKVTWVRSTGTGKRWFVKFKADSPCAEPGPFGAARKKICTINVCKTAGPDCKSYKYSSATGPTAPVHDPDIIVDP